MLRIVGSLTPKRRHRFNGFMVDCLEVSDRLLVGFVQGVQQFEYVGSNVKIRHTPFVSIWNIEVESGRWVFCHPRRAILVPDVPTGIRIQGKSVSRGELALLLKPHGFG
jgi:hypothetical protein